MTVPSFGPRMVCTVCGAIGADATPNWQERVTTTLFRSTFFINEKAASRRPPALERLTTPCVSAAYSRNFLTMWTTPSKL